ncbi:DNA-binding transcriptional ArsR family regulator [Microbacterium sp. AG790]|uniref:ArsR/SmtB family transcription factor n=1 Tax=Microbacterium sp. AG790 TaxID=2183995 RepID=UPI000EAD0CDB|nr:helix-turn-helix transcriptional regulator [Microbacterium sp. AG790]RKS94313.1 DNA-binding transcriptional ArsR family regulator [Microbacterium sp. AG790]
MQTPEQIPGLADLDRLDAVFAALAHRTRRAILVTLRANGGSQTSGKIAGRMDNSWQTTSRHLRQLEEAGLISVGLQGRERIYTLNDAFMREVLHDWGERFRP